MKRSILFISLFVSFLIPLFGEVVEDSLNEREMEIERLCEERNDVYRMIKKTRSEAQRIFVHDKLHYRQLMEDLECLEYELQCIDCRLNELVTTRKERFNHD